MRNIGAMIIVAVMFMLGLVAFLLWGPLSEKPGMRAVIEETPEAPAGVPVTGRSEASARPGARRSAGSSEAAEAVETAQLPEGARPVEIPSRAARAARNFPTAADLPIGLEKSKLQASFGKPTMRTTVVEQGRLLETFVYLQSDPDTATFVLLRNGRVVSANTTIY